MTLFWILTALMVLAALASLVPALLGDYTKRDFNRNEQNVTVAREYLAELESELAQGHISQELFDQSKTELEQTLLQDLQTTEKPSQPFFDRDRSAWPTLVLLALAVPLLTVSLYLFIGTPSYFFQTTSGAGSATVRSASAPATLEEAVAVLEARLKKEPDDMRGWFMLARSYMALEKYEQAATVYERLAEQFKEDPVILLALADALSMSQGGKLAGRPTQLAQRVLELQPSNTSALWLLGMAADQAKDYPQALKFWRQLEPLLQDKPELLEQLHAMMAEIEQLIAKESGAM